MNYDRKYRGPVTLNEALAKSLNTVAAQLVMEVGPQTVVETAHRLGIRSSLKANASISLGTSEVTLMELTSAYAPFSNGGRLVEPYIVRQVKDLDGKVIYQRKGFDAPTIVRARELGMMNAMLREVIRNGTGRSASLPNREAAGKTGTSQKSRDGWFVGYTADMVTGVWFGNDDGSPTKKVTGGSLPAKAWQEIMKVAHGNLPPADLPGRYEPVVASVPPIVPSRPVANTQGRTRESQSIGNIIQQENNTAAPRRRSLSEIDRRAPRPSAGVGEIAPRQQPRTILDLLFGG